MDELKLVLDIIKSLPEMAIWALIILYAYKISIVGSIYGVIRYVAGRLYDWGIHKKTDVPKVQEIHFADIFHGITISSDETLANLVRQIRRMQGVKTSSQYIHKQDVDWLREAIDEKLDKEKTV